MRTPCARCGEMVDQNTDRPLAGIIEQVLATFNSVLVRGGRPTIKREESVMCGGCYQAWQADRHSSVMREWAECRKWVNDFAAGRCEEKDIPLWVRDDSDWNRQIQDIRATKKPKLGRKEANI